jgi:hypothetical protein
MKCYWKHFKGTLFDVQNKQGVLQTYATTFHKPSDYYKNTDQVLDLPTERKKQCLLNHTLVWIYKYR